MKTENPLTEPSHHSPKAQTEFIHFPWGCSLLSLSQTWSSPLVLLNGPLPLRLMIPPTKESCRCVLAVYGYLFITQAPIHLSHTHIRGAKFSIRSVWSFPTAPCTIHNTTLFLNSTSFKWSAPVHNNQFIKLQEFADPVSGVSLKLKFSYFKRSGCFFNGHVSWIAKTRNLHLTWKRYDFQKHLWSLFQNSGCY